MRTIEDYDSKAEQRRLSALLSDFALAERQGLAQQAALKRHQVVDYVMNLPIQSSKYPAIEYLDLQCKSE